MPTKTADKKTSPHVPDSSAAFETEPYELPLIDPKDSVGVFLRMPRIERDLWTECARRETRNRTNWVRHVCLEAAAKQLGLTESDFQYQED